MKKAIIFLCLVFLIPTNKVQATEVDFVISEIMYDCQGGDSGHEWIEVFNGGQEAVDVLIGAGSDTWRFFDGANHILNLQQGTSTIGPEEYFIIAQDAEQFLIDYPDFGETVFDTVMNLRNSSSGIALSFDGGDTYQVEDFYDSIWGAAGNGFSLEKINLATSSTIDNWQESAVLSGTPGKINSEVTVDDPPEEEDPPDDEDPVDEESPIEELGPAEISGGGSVPDSSIYWRDIIISEFIPNPVGSDDGEWIELHNIGAQKVDLVGFSLQDNSTRLFTLDEDSDLDLILDPGKFFILDKSHSKISLNNTGGDSVKLYDPNGDPRDNVSYLDTALEGRSFARHDNNFVWTGEPTPGKENIFVANQPPVAKITLKLDEAIVGEKIILSAEESYDPEEGSLEYFWDFGDETSGDEKTENHVYEAEGNYLIKLKVSDSEDLIDETNLLLEIVEIEKDIKLEEVQPINFDLADLIISEFIPNPVGSDDGEWIEIYNNSDEEINLLAWQIDDQEGGSKPYIISEDILIPAKSFFVIKRSDSKITLNNSNDAVRLLTPLGETWQEVSYEKTVEGKSQAWDFDNEEWFEAEPSPGSVNIFYENVAPEYIYSAWETKELDKGSEILVQGAVLQENGTSLYLLDWDGEFIDYSNLIEVYFHSKNFPDLEKGQIVTVFGEISREGSLPRIKIKNPEQIWSNDLEIKILDPEILELEDISEDNFDSWQKIRGIITKKSGKNIYLATDIDEDHLLRIYTKFSSKDLYLKKGQEIIASGLFVETDNLAKLTVFDIENILVSQQVLGDKIENIEPKTNQSSTEYKIETESKDNDLILFVVAFLIVLILLYFINKKYLHKF